MIKANEALGNNVDMPHISSILSSNNSSIFLSSPSPFSSPSNSSLSKQLPNNQPTPPNILPYQENIGGTTYFYRGDNVNTSIISPINHYDSPSNSNVNHSPVAMLNNFSNPNRSLARNSTSSHLYYSKQMTSDVPQLNLMNTPSSLPPSLSASPFFTEANLARHLRQPRHPTSFSNQSNPYFGLVLDDRYHSLEPLRSDYHEKTRRNNSCDGDSPKKRVSLFKAIDVTDGHPDCLARIHDYSLSNVKMRKALTNWKKFEHINCVKLKEVFSTKAFGDSSLVFVYQYHPSYVTLRDYYYSLKSRKPNMASSNLRGGMNIDSQNVSLNSPDEGDIWNFVIQISGSLRRIHSSNLYCGGLDGIKPSKILIDPLDQKIKLNCLGMVEILNSENDSSNNAPLAVTHFQQEDLKATGRLILSMTTSDSYTPICDNTVINNGGAGSGGGNNNKWMIHALKSALTSTRYCDDLKNILLYLLTPPVQNTFNENQTKNRNASPQKTALKSVNDIMPMIGARFYAHIEKSAQQYAYIKDQLSLELENGRIFRLLCKLNTIVERPEHNMDVSWSETGDRYLLKLFRDFLFYSRKHDGTPFLDLSHIIIHLNKLDTGNQDRITLTSRDERNMIIVSYADLNKCLQSSFSELFAES
ncbi:PAN2-PAN3 deadenylation complex subunit Pan3-like isoform X2 [Gordionus sp. m RMFG-2023]|uniref:PAN2-PAN3 deadenylation complex subunit Pan3-like isoform X2 n=1 Tax=Gordionus sp. m RMFG-2023 TaxID=3053472 RepID=UPI0031FCAFC1